jgi:hypothetical protein
LYALLAIVFITTFPVPAASQQVTSYDSDFLNIQLTDDQPGFVAISVDSLGRHKLLPSPLCAPAPSITKYEFHRSGDRVEYRVAGASPKAAPAWSFELSARTIRLHSSYSPQNQLPSLLLNFNPHVNRATLLGLINDDGSVRLPAILHLPDRGTFRITSSNRGAPALPYDAVRQPKGQRENDYVTVTIPSASANALAYHALMGMAYGLTPPDKANTIMDHLLAKMKQVGYAKFEYGLPGNLAPIARATTWSRDASGAAAKRMMAPTGFRSTRTAEQPPAMPTARSRPFISLAAMPMRFYFRS